MDKRPSQRHTVQPGKDLAQHTVRLDDCEEEEREGTLESRAEWGGGEKEKEQKQGQETCKEKMEEAGKRTEEKNERLTGVQGEEGVRRGKEKFEQCHCRRLLVNPCSIHQVPLPRCCFCPLVDCTPCQGLGIVLSVEV